MSFLVLCQKDEFTGQTNFLNFSNVNQFAPTVVGLNMRYVLPDTFIKTSKRRAKVLHIYFLLLIILVNNMYPLFIFNMTCL